MVENSNFKDKNELREIIKKYYGIDAFDITKIDRGSANLFSINNNEYVLKEFQSHISRTDVNKEIDIIKFLKERNVPVPEYIRLQNGSYSFSHKENVIIMQKFIKGYTKKRNEGNLFETLESARYLGIIVKTLEDYKNIKDYTNKFDFSDKKGIIKKYKQLEQKLDLYSFLDLKIKTDIDDKIYMLERLKTDIPDLDKTTIKASHGDYNVLQFIYKDGKINAVIDFINASKLPIIWEVIRSYSYIDRDAKNGEFNMDTFIRYVDEFSKYIRLNEYDLKYMVKLYLIQTLFSEHGYYEYINNRNMNNLLEFGRFRTNNCRYLFENEEIITKRLVKEIEHL